MKQKSVFGDRSFWSLLIINVSIIIYYLYYHTGFKTLVWIYWSQSVLIGLFTFIDLLTVKNIAPDAMQVNGEPVKDGPMSKGCIAPFFAFHYGMFHLVYLIFIFTITDTKEFLDWNLFEFSVGAFALDQAWNFFRTKQWEQTHPANPGVIFFLPYVRVIPMHLTILIPAFIKAIPQLGIFLLLKLLADLITHVLVTRIYGKTKEMDPTILT